MSRYIDADKLQKELASMWYESNISVTGISVSELIDAQPTADVRENVRGEWIKRDGIYRCSICDYPTSVVYNRSKSVV